MATNWMHRRGALERDGWESVVDSRMDGWRHTGIRVATLGSEPLWLPAGEVERMIVPLTGDVTVDWSRDDEAGSIELAGRGSVFDGPADVAYLGLGAAASLRGTGGRVAVAEAPATEQLPTQVIRAAETPVEIRGAGRSTRQVHNFGTPGALNAQKLIVCEVITPAENWSSYPPHKHDEQVPGTESQLEEIYYFESEVTRDAAFAAPVDAEPFGLFATYGSPAGRIEIDAMVRTGDIALVPFGYHGPAVAAPGYDLYYLNVMAGPDPERAWNITDDPAHGWVRQTWTGQEPDPRLPYSAGRTTDATTDASPAAAGTAASTAAPSADAATTTDASTDEEARA